VILTLIFEKMNQKCLPNLLPTKIWDSLLLTLKLCPSRILKYNPKSKLFIWSKNGLFPWFLFFFISGLVNVLLLLAYLIFKIKYIPMPNSSLAIHVIMLFMAGFAWTLGISCSHAMLKNHSNICFVFNYASIFYWRKYGKLMLDIGT